MPTWVEILYCLDEEIGLVCWQLVHDMYATEIFGIQPSCKLSLFFMKLSELTGYFYYLWEAKSIWKKSKPWKQLSDVLETNSLTLMKVLTFFSEIFL